MPPICCQFETLSKKELKIRETYRKRRSASGKVRRQILPKMAVLDGVPIEEVHLPCDMNPEYTNFTFYETFEKSFKNLLELSLDQLEINGKIWTVHFDIDHELSNGPLNLSQPVHFEMIHPVSF